MLSECLSKDIEMYEEVYSGTLDDDEEETSAPKNLRNLPAKLFPASSPSITV